MHSNFCCLLIGVLCSMVSARSHHHFRGDFQVNNNAEVVTNANRIGIREEFVGGVSSGVHYNPYSKQHPGRHVCTLQKNLTVPVMSKETYCKPVYKKYVEPCNDNQLQLCTGVRLVYETSYKDVVSSKTTKHVTFTCCPGWLQTGNRSHGCNRPICNGKCQNGGICVKPDICKCLKGFTGKNCETDINECVEHKPCDQMCHNTYGSFICRCRENFVLRSDQQTCEKEGSENNPGLEAKDLEYEQLDKRLHKLEVMFETEIPNRNLNSEINKLSSNIEELNKEVNSLKYKMENMERNKDDTNFINKDFWSFKEKPSVVNERREMYSRAKVPSYLI